MLENGFDEDNHATTKNGAKELNGDHTASSMADLSITHPLEVGVSIPQSQLTKLLQHEWTFWYDKRWVRGGEVSYENNLKKIGTFGTVENFWRQVTSLTKRTLLIDCISRHYNHMAKPAQLEWDSNYYLFKKGIKPMWEDEANHLVCTGFIN